MQQENIENKLNMVDEIIKSMQYCNQQIDSEEVGIVLDSGDGIARVGGLPGALVGEMLDFGDDVFGVVFNLEMEEIEGTARKAAIKEI